MNFGGFSEEALKVLDFARCQRPDGTIYASATNNCRKGKLIGPDEGKEKKRKEGKKEKEPTPKKSPGREEERAKFRKIVEEDAKKLDSSNQYKTGSPEFRLSLLEAGYTAMKSMYKDPAWKTPENKARLINMRLLINKTRKEIRESKEGAKLDPKSYKEALDNSPKYSKTPGRKTAIKKAKAEDVPKLEAQMKNLLDKLGKKGISKEESLKVGNEMLEVNQRLMVAIGDGKPSSPGLKQIYKEQGFNAKPELVATAGDLRRRKDLLNNLDGSPMVIYRGVTTKEYADQFKGLGSDGDQHFPGRGIFGNGSYAATGSYHDHLATADTARKTAVGYTGSSEGLASKVTAFGLRKDANVFTAKGGSYNERTGEYDSWYDRTIKEAEEKTGYRFTDIGEAAAALGYHAYQVPQRNEDYWVVLNRGAVVAAMDSEIGD